MASKAEAHPGQKKEAHKDSERDKYGKVAVNVGVSYWDPGQLSLSVFMGKAGSNRDPISPVVQMK